MLKIRLDKAFLFRVETEYSINHYLSPEPEQPPRSKREILNCYTKSGVLLPLASKTRILIELKAHLFKLTTLVIKDKQILNLLPP